MLYKLYGFTAVNIILSGMPPRMYRECLDGYSKDPLMLTIVKRQFEEIEKVITSIPNEYINPLDKRAYARLRRLEIEDPSNPQIAELKSQLDGKPVDIAQFLIIDGERKPISDVSKAIILELKKSLNTIRNYKNTISINYKTEKEELFFGYPLYQLRSYSEGHLMFLLNKHLKKYVDRNRIKPEFWDSVRKFVEVSLSYVSDQEENVVNLSSLVIDDVKNFVSKYDYTALNSILGIDATLEEYYQASLELHDIGLVGFTPFTEQMFEEFLNNYNPSYNSDMHISTDSSLYGFVTNIKRALDSNLTIGDSIKEKTETEEEKEISIEV